MTASLDTDLLRLRYSHANVSAMLSDFGEAVRTARRATKSAITEGKFMGIREFAALFDIRYQLMHDIERGVSLLPTDKMMEVCKWLMAHEQ